MKEYVLGFLFNVDLTQVVLIQKSRPAWQAGKFNGVGGHVEEGELPAEAMAREFAEETGYRTRASMWRHYAIMRREFVEPQFVCHVFRCVANIKDLGGLVRTAEDQPVVVAPTDRLPLACVSNLPWLIPMAMDKDGALGHSYDMHAVVGAAGQFAPTNAGLPA